MAIFLSHFASALMRAAAEHAENTLLAPVLPFRSLPRFLPRKAPLALLLVLLTKLASDPLELAETLERDENCAEKLSMPTEPASEPLNREDRGADNPPPPCSLFVPCAQSGSARFPLAMPGARPHPLSLSTG